MYIMNIGSWHRRKVSKYRLTDLACLKLSLISAARDCVLVLGIRRQQLRSVVVDHMMFLFSEMAVKCIIGFKLHVAPCAFELEGLFLPIDQAARRSV